MKDKDFISLVKRMREIQRDIEMMETEKFIYWTFYDDLKYKGLLKCKEELEQEVDEYLEKFD